MASDREKSSKERVRAILSESVSVLCRTMLQYDAELSIRGLLGITVDNRDVFLVDILETVHGRNHDVSGVAVIDPGKEDSEADMLVVDDSDIDDKHHSMTTHSNQQIHAKTKCSEQMPLNTDQEQPNNTQGDVVQMISNDSLSRHSIGLKELGDAALARSIGQFPQLAHKALNLKSTINLSSGINRVSGDSGEMQNPNVIASQALNMSTTSQGENAPADPNDDPNFRLQNQDTDRQHVATSKQNEEGREDGQEAQPTMYTLCACENGTGECTMKHGSNQGQATWSHNDNGPRSGEYASTPGHVPPPPTPITQTTTTAVTQVAGAANPANPELPNQDPYQIWSKANQQQGGALTTSGAWTSLPTVQTVSTLPTTVWAGQTQPHPLTVTVSTSSESMTSAPIQSLYSSLPETISSAILNTTYSQGSTTPKNLRGEGVFPCKLCSRVFTYKKSKARHMKVHLGQFYTCEVCKKTLCRKDVLARHQHNVHGIKMEGSHSENGKNAHKQTQQQQQQHQQQQEEPPTMSLLSQNNEVSANTYQTVQSNNTAQLKYENVEFSGTNAPQLTVPRPPLAVVTSLSQPIQSFLALSHAAVPSHPSPNQTGVQSNVQTSLHHESP